ncbi:MAG: catecholate siderophore receptor CirA [Verrucomicrobia bacterium]|nr:catecholate siderophore receptor CirA [Verrucomicrobiota bacterium]
MKTVTPALSCVTCQETFERAPAALAPLLVRQLWNRWSYQPVRRILTLLALLPLAAMAQSSGTVEGRVFNGVAGTYLVNVRVSVDGTNRETLTDPDGNYRLANLPAGTVRVRAAYVGLAENVQSVEVAVGKVTQQNFELARAGVTPTAAEVTQMKEYKVVAERQYDAQALALNEQRRSPNIKNVVAMDEYPNGTTGNLGDTIRFIPGVTLSYSGYVPSEVSVRGLPTDMTNVTIDGSPVAAAFFAQTRAASLLSVPMNNVSRIEVTKVPTPDMSASGLGGTVNLISKGGFESKARLITYELYTTFRPDFGFSLDERTGPMDKLTTSHFKPSAGFTYSQPITSSLAVSLSASTKSNYLWSNETGSTWDLIKLIQTANTLTSVPQIVTTRNARVGLDWKLGDKNVFGLSYQVSEYDSLYMGTLVGVTYGTGATGGVNADGAFTQGAATGVGTLTQSGSAFKMDIRTKHLRFKYRFDGDVWKVSANSSYSRSYSTPRNTSEGFFQNFNATIPNLVIRGEGVTGTGETRESTAPTRYTVTDRNGAPVDLYNGNNYSLNNASSFIVTYLTEKADGRVDVGREFATSNPTAIKAGVGYSQEVSIAENYSETFNFRTGAPVADRMAGLYGLVDTDFSDQVPSVLGRKVQRITARKVYQLYAAHPEYFIRDDVGAFTTYANNSKEITEDILSAYLRGDIRLLNNRWWIVAGVRYERTMDDAVGPLNDPNAVYQRNANGSFILDAGGNRIFRTTNLLERAKQQYTPRGSTAERNYQHLFPSVNSTFNLTNDFVARFGYAKTIGRPNLPNVIPSVSLSAVTPSSTTQVVTVVNTGLKPWTADNYDFTLDSYLIKNGFGSIGVFQKDIKNFFVTTSQDGTPALLAQYGIISPNPELLYTVNTLGNGGAATIRGLEFNYKQSLTFLPHWARGVQVFFNYTRATVGGPNSGDFIGFSPKSQSWGINLLRPRYSVKLSRTEQAQSRRAIAGASATIPAGTYTYQGGKRTLTLEGEYRFSRSVSLFGSISDFDKNNGFVDELFRYGSESTPQYARSQRYQEWGMRAALGIKGEF